MSERNLIALGVGAIGFIFGGPAGFSFGFTLGGLIGALLFPEKIKGPRVKDLDVQISTYGEVIPLAWGWVRMAGNIIWATDIVEKKKEVSSFLGPTQVTYKYFGNFAVMLCEGPVKKINRVWADSKLILYRDEKTGRLKGKGKKWIEFFYGDDEQYVSSLQEAWDGVGNVPAYKDVAYIEFEMMKLSDFGNRIPSINVEFFAGQQATVPAGNWSAINEPGFFALGMNKKWYLAGQRAENGGLRVRGYLIADNVPTGNTITHSWEATCPYMNYFINWTLTSNSILVVLDPNQRILYTFDANDDGDVKGPFPLMPPWGSQYGAQVFEHVLSRKVDGGQLINAFWSGGWSTHYCSGDGSLYLSGYGGSFNWCTMMTAGKEYVYGIYVVFASPQRWLAIGTGYGRLVDINPEIEPQSSIYSFYYDKEEDCLACACQDGLYVYSADLTKLIKYRAWPSNFGLPANINTFISIYHGFKDGSLIVKRHGYDIYGMSNNIFIEFSLPYGRIQQIINTAQDTLWDQKNRYYETFGVNPRRNFLLVPGGEFTRLWYLPDRTYKMTLQQIVYDINIRAGLEPSDFDVTALDDVEVTGYYVNKEASARTMLEPLMATYFFEGIECDGKIIYQHKNRPSFATINTKYLGTSETGKLSPLLTEGRTQELDMPAEITLKYPSKALDYNQNGQKARRSFETQHAEQRTSLEVPIVLEDAQAKKMAEVMLLESWAGRTNFEFTLPRRYIELNPGDAVTIQHDGREFLIYIESIDFGANGMLRCTGRSHDPEVYNGIGLPAVVPPYQPILPDEIWPAFTQFIDGPLLIEAYDKYPVFYAAGEGEGSWPGGSIYVSSNNQDFVGVTNITEEAVIGTCVTVLDNFANNCAVDYDSRVRVALGDGGSLSSCTLTDMLANGKNFAMIGNELVQFQNAVAVDVDVDDDEGTTSTIYELSWFVRGCRGTEMYMGTHAVGDRFIFLQNGVFVGVPVQTSDIGQTRYWKHVTLGLQEEDTSSFSFTPQINQWKPLAPAHAVATRSSNNWTISWSRRARKDFEWQEFEVPLDEPYMRFEVDILTYQWNLRRTIVVDGATSCTYTSAQQIADFGSNQTSIYFRIYQISSRVGRGFVAQGQF